MAVVVGFSGFSLARLTLSRGVFTTSVRRMMFTDRLWPGRQLSHTHLTTTAHQASRLQQTTHLLLSRYGGSPLNPISVGRKVNRCCCCLSDPVHNSLLHSSAINHNQHQLGKRQSPIHITTADTVTSKDLKPLNFIKGWADPMSGTLDNLGYTVTFRPKSSSVTTLQTHTGEYVFDNFHYHWGERAGCGSEHLVDGKQYDLEIHFVFKKVNNTDPNAGDAISVLGIFGEIDNSAEISGIWKQVTPTKVLHYKSVEEINDVIYSDLLPNSRDYFHYEGSLTTPGYDEVVQWFVLREPIQVPALYFDQLRDIQDAQGNKIAKNYRELQDLNGRVVKRLELTNREDKKRTQ